MSIEYENRLNNYIRMFENELRNLTATPNDWLKFLYSACHNYKLDFKELVLVNTTFPNSTAVLPKKAWVEKFGRMIDKNAVAIPSIVFNGSNSRVKLYYDISQTIETEKSKPVPLWKYDIKDEQSIVTAFNKKFGLKAKSFETVIAGAINILAKSNSENNYQILKNVYRKATISRYDNARKIHSDIVAKSAMAVICSRCGFDITKIFNFGDFREVTYYDSSQAAVALGNATFGTAKSILQIISYTIQKERVLNNGKRNNNSLWSGVRQGQRGILDANSPTPEIGVEYVGNGKERISENEQSSRIRYDADVRGNLYPPRNNSDSGTGEVRNIDRAEEESIGSNRGTQGERLAQVGTISQQHSGGSSSDSPQRINISTDNLTDIRKAEVVDSSSAFSISQAELNTILSEGSSFYNGKYRIYEQFLKGESLKDNAKFLKDEYGIGGKSSTRDFEYIAADWDGKGLSLTNRNTKAKLLIKWDKAAKIIDYLIKDDRYLSAAEKQGYIEYKKAKEKPTEEKEVIETAAKDLALSYSVGNKCYIGSDEYKIVGITDNTVSLYDSRFPLLSTEMSKEEFERRITENTLNEHLYAAEQQSNTDTANETATQAAQGNDITITCEWSEHSAFENGKTYSAADFDRIMKSADDEWVRLRQYEQDVYGDMDAIYKAYEDGEIDGVHQGYAKTKFTINMPDGTKYTLRQDIGDGDGGVIDFLTSIESYKNIVPMLEQARDNEPSLLTPVYGEKFAKELEQQSDKLSAPNENVQQPQEDIIISSDGKNYAITDDNFADGTKSERYEYNINAIKTLKELEKNNRQATPTEQEILAKYVGWGGLDSYFKDENNGQLKALLDESEYKAALASTLTSFYTPPTVIRAVYKVLDNLGFKSGNVLEPSCGVGNFIGLCPQSMESSKFYGVELDDISGRIASKLYPQANIAVQGFETTNLPDNFFDVAVGNVPFAQMKVLDKKYDKYNFLIHDYFFAKTLDKVRPGGIVAFITSKGTMDKKSCKVRKYIAQRAELLGAVRLPNNTFSRTAGTKVTSDVLFLQKRERMIDIEPDWVHLCTDDNGITINSYFIEHPEMVLGEMQEVSGPYGAKAECIAYDNANLEDLLNEAVANINGEYKAQEIEQLFDDDTQNIEEADIIPATPDVKNFSYTVVDGDIYYRQNSIMERQKLNATAEKRIKALVKVREALRGVLNNQLEDMPDEVIKNSQLKLNNLYDNFINEFGYINTRANLKAFEKDDSINLLASLEKFDSEKNYKGKSDIFSRRTVKPHKAIDKVETAADALAVSIAEKAKVDLEYMSKLYGKSVNNIVDELEGAIFNVPGTDEYQTADEYLSGNVRRKLRTALSYSYDKPEKYDSNIAALKAVQPTDLTASEIDVRLGATWLPVDVVRDFMYTTFGTPRYVQDSIEVSYSEYNSEWRISHKSLDKSVNAVSNYGTKRVNAYKILEDTLNLKDVRVFDNIYDDGKEKRVLNKEETAIAQSKQELIKSRFASWVFSERNRRERLCRIYNERFNSVRPREYDGSFLVFDGMNTEIRLRDHQRNAVAHAIYGGNTLLAHTVGAGKTFEMVAIAMESKRLGLCNKSLFVVPNHLTEQMGIEFMQLYPAANILVATKKDFETANRKKFCSRIATGDYDAVVIGHSQFEKIPMSTERQCQIIEIQIDEVIESIRFAEGHNAENFTIKQLEKTKKNLETKLKKLYDQSRKDDVVTFEELGVDKLFVDEAHYYKNLFLYTKMRNVAGVGQTEAQKSSDLFMKCRYLDEITDGKGVVFATGTPISNSMTELYTMQRYLQYNKLSEQGLSNFDAWASTFGETITALELSPEGNGYRAKTRFAKFFNLPELMSTFREIADIKTADVLNLDVPEVERHNVLTIPSEQQEQILEGLAQRAEIVRNGNVDPSTDNMLKITNDGRKLALDQRLINPMLPDFEGSKLNACADNIFSLWDKTKEDRLAQMVFCDISTPNGDKFNVYDDLKEKLMVKGIPENEIAFIHDAKTNQQKQDIFSKVRSGNIRVIIGSTSKMGAGTNCQDKLIALHHLDCPWRPADLQQREGRIIRQGNKNPLVHIYSYVTENTFDAYLYQLVENKQKFISQIMTSKSPVRSAEDVDETALSYSEIKALASGNPLIKEKMDLDVQVSKLKILKANFLSVKYELEDQIASTFPQKISSAKYNVEKIKRDIELAKSHINDDFALKIKGITYNDKKEAGQQLLLACDKSIGSDKVRIGEYKGFILDLRFDSYHSNKYILTLNGSAHYDVELGQDIFGNLTRIDNVLKSLPGELEKAKNELSKVESDCDSAKEAVNTTFDKEEELNTKLARLKELNAILEMDNSSTKKEDTSNDSEYHYTKVTEKQKEILSSNGYKDFAKADDGKNFIVKYPTVDKDKVQHLLCNNTIKL